MHEAKLISITPDAEYIMGYCARASSPKNQKKMEEGELSPAGLLKYCAKKGHWSIYEVANACVEIYTTRAISAQILRHRSFSFQEQSYRYCKLFNGIELPEMRRGGTKNRQSSVEDKELDEATKLIVETQIKNAEHAYKQLLDKGVATECARMILPMCSPTKLYMNGSIRSWVHYLDLRCKPDVQKEHRQVARSIRKILAKELPICAEAFDWGNDD